MVTVPDEQIWIVVVGFILAFILTLGIGANDVANAWATSVGAEVITLRNASILASIFEVLGAVLMGAKVSDTVRKGILDTDAYANETELFMVGNIAALGGAGVWQVIATFFKMPVSGTHSIIGAILGFTLVAKGANGVSWGTLLGIVLSWFVSPVMSGLISTLIFLLCKFFILNKLDPLEPGLRFLPIFYAATLVVNMFSIFFEGPELLGFDRIPLWGTFILAFGSGIVIGIIVRIIIVPWQRVRIRDQVKKQQELDLQAQEGKPNECTSINGDVQAELKNGELANGYTYTNTGFEGDTTTEKHNGKLALEKDDDKTGKTGIIKRIRTLSQRSRGDAEDSITLTDHEDIAAYTGIPDKSSTKLENVSLDDDPAALSKDSGISNGDESSIATQSSQMDKDPEALAAEEENYRKLHDRPETVKLFSFLQILSAVFGSFAHGGNDVSNAIGPVVSIWLTATTQEIAGEAATPIWILFFGGFGISVGLWIWGRRVIETMGQDLSTITPSSGFSIELGAAATVLIASNIGIPISSTHCKVGSIVFVGRARAKTNVDWKLFRNIILAWVITLPATGLVSAGLMALLQLAV